MWGWEEDNHLGMYLAALRVRTSELVHIPPPYFFHGKQTGRFLYMAQQ